MKNIRIFSTILFLTYCFFILVNMFILPPNFDQQIYIHGGHVLLEGQKYGVDFVDSKPAVFFWIYAFLIKIFTAGKPILLAQVIFYFITFLLSVSLFIAVSYRIFRNYLKALLSTFIYVLYFTEFSPDAINSELFTNIFILLSLFFFISKKGEYGHNWFLSGLFIGIASFIRIPSIINFGVLPLVYFCIHYDKTLSFFSNMKLSLKKNIKFYLLFTFGTFLPFLLYFVYLSLTHNFTPFLNYLKYVSQYGQESHNIINALVHYRFIEIFFLFFLSFLLCFKKQRKIFIFCLCYFIINLIFSYLLLMGHHAHYFYQTFLIFPVMITAAITPLFTKKTKTILEKLILFLCFIIFIHVGFITKINSINDCISSFTLENLFKRVPLVEAFKEENQQKTLKELKDTPWFQQKD